MDTQNYKDLENRITKLEEKLTYMTQLLEEQHNYFFPGVGKRLANWVLQHWLLLLFFTLAGYAVYEIYAFIELVNTEIESMQQRLNKLVDSVKFWK